MQLLNVSSGMRKTNVDTKYTVKYFGGLSPRPEVREDGRIMSPEEVAAKLNSLRDALTEAHRVILHELDSGRTPYLLPVANGGKGFGYLEDVLSGVTR